MSSGKKHILDRLYDKAAGALQYCLTKAKADPVYFKRLATLMGVCMGLLLVVNFIIGPVVDLVTLDTELRSHKERMKSAFEKAANPSDKAALNLLMDCVRTNRSIRAETSAHVSTHAEEQLCMAQYASIALLSNGEAKSREVLATYERLGLKMDDQLKRYLEL